MLVKNINPTKGILIGISLILIASLLIPATYLQLYSYNRPSYYNQYNYNLNNYRYGYISTPFLYKYNIPLVRLSPHSSYYHQWPSNYVSGYDYTGKTLLHIPNTPDTQGRITYSSRIYPENALMATYYNNPWLLEPRRMNNNQGMIRGVWPSSYSQNYWY